MHTVIFVTLCPRQRRMTNVGMSSYNNIIFWYYNATSTYFLFIRNKNHQYVIVFREQKVSSGDRSYGHRGRGDGRAKAGRRFDFSVFWRRPLYSQISWSFGYSYLKQYIFRQDNGTYIYIAIYRGIRNRFIIFIFYTSIDIKNNIHNITYNKRRTKT